MTSQDAAPLADAWAWWEARRLRYNLALSPTA